MSSFEVVIEGGPTQIMTRVHTRCGEVFDVIEPIESLVEYVEQPLVGELIELKSDG